MYVDNTFGESLLFINFINNPCELDKSAKGMVSTETQVTKQVGKLVVRNIKTFFFKDCVNKTRILLLIIWMDSFYTYDYSGKNN